VSAHQHLAHRGEPGALGVGEIREAQDLARVDLGVLADEPLARGLRLRVEGVPPGAHVRELGVAAGRRNAVGVQQGVLRGGRLERAVGVPEPVAEREEPRAVVPLEHALVLVEVRHIRERGGDTVPIGLTQTGVDGLLDRPQREGEGHLLLEGHRPAVEDQHRVPVHAGVDAGRVLGGERPGEVDAVHLAGEAGSDLSDRDGHQRFSAGVEVAGPMPQTWMMVSSFLAPS
jgi:hypothetical protein